MKARKHDMQQDRAHPSHARVPEDRRATEYLANERTFLAWIRTSIAVVGMGFVITRLAGRWALPGVTHLRSPATSFSLGIGLMAFGALLAILAVWRYHVVMHAIDQGKVKPDRGLVMLVTLLVVFIAVGTILFMLLAE